MRQFGLDKPLSTQFFIYLGNLLQGNLGDSFFYKKPVAACDAGSAAQHDHALRALAGPGVHIRHGRRRLLAWRRGSKLENAGIIYTLISRSAPEFWVGMILLTVFAFRLKWFPGSGATSPGVIYSSFWAQLVSLDYWRHLVLPVLTLAFYLQGLPLLLMRSNMLDVMQEDFVTLARMKGISEWRIMLRHAARNALLPVVTAMAMGIGYAIGGDVVVETIFSWPGLGRMLVRAVAASDYPVAQGAFLTIASDHGAAQPAGRHPLLRARPTPGQVEGGGGMTVDVPLPAEPAVETADEATGETLAAETTAAGGAPSSWAAVWSAMRRDHFAMAGLVIYGFFLLLAIIGPWIAPHDPLAGDERGQQVAQQPAPFGPLLPGHHQHGARYFLSVDCGRTPGHHRRFLRGLHGRGHRHHCGAARRLLRRARLTAS